MNKETALSLLLAFVVVFGGVALLNKSIKPISLNTVGPATQESKTQKHYRPQDTEPARATIAPRQSRRMTQAELDAALNQESEQSTDTENTGGIKKCTLNGKVTYSHNPCPKNASVANVFINDSAGVVSPDRDTVDKTIGKIAAENRQNREQNNAVVTLVETKKKVSPFCDNYKNQIEYLDARARQGNTSSVTERIRQERWEVQKLQLAGNCYKNR